MPLATKIKPKTIQHVTRDFQKNTLRESIEKIAKREPVTRPLEPEFYVNSIRNARENSFKNQLRTILKTMPQGYQHGAEIDAKSRNKSLLKQVSNKK